MGPASLKATACDPSLRVQRDPPKPGGPAPVDTPSLGRWYFQAQLPWASPLPFPSKSCFQYLGKKAFWNARPIFAWTDRGPTLCRFAFPSRKICRLRTWAEGLSSDKPSNFSDLGFDLNVRPTGPLSLSKWRQHLCFHSLRDLLPHITIYSPDDPHQTLARLPWWLSGKESICQAGNSGSIPGLGRYPAEGNGNSLQCSCLQNLIDRGAWWATAHRVTKELDTTWWLNKTPVTCTSLLSPWWPSLLLLPWRLSTGWPLSVCKPVPHLLPIPVHTSLSQRGLGWGAHEMFPLAHPQEHPGPFFPALCFSLLLPRPPAL